jgi:hypothetical protein
MANDNPALVSSVRWAEKRYLWACYLYYHGEQSPVDDTEHDATERQLELTRDLWSDYFKSKLVDPSKQLKTQAHAITLTEEEIGDACMWSMYVEFLRKHCK